MNSNVFILGQWSCAGNQPHDWKEECQDRQSQPHGVAKHSRVCHRGSFLFIYRLFTRYVWMSTESSLCNMQPTLRLYCCGLLTFCFEEMMVCGVSRIPGPVSKIGYAQFSTWAYMLLSWLLHVRAPGMAWPYVVCLNIYVCQKITFCLREFLWSSGPKHSLSKDSLVFISISHLCVRLSVCI